jgi:hypothetical protein
VTDPTGPHVGPAGGEEPTALVLLLPALLEALAAVPLATGVADV